MLSIVRREVRRCIEASRANGAGRSTNSSSSIAAAVNAASAIAPFWLGVNGIEPG
jgi:hypothetical protein